jgi:hypothetical protein
MNLARRVRIVYTGAVYSTINQTDALSWPTEEIKCACGEGSDPGWGEFAPAEGDEGEVVWASTHPDSGVTVYLVALGGRYVTIGERGVEFLDGGPPSGPIELSPRRKRRR